MAMKLSTGKVAFPIEFDNGDKQNIYFNPRSKTFREKILNFEKSIDERLKKIDIEKHKSAFEGTEDINIDITDIDALMQLDPEQLDSVMKRAKAVNDIDAEYQQAIKDELDDIFESPISDIVFKYCEPMDVVTYTNDDGNEESEMFIMQFVRALYSEMSKYANEQAPAMEKRMSKYKDMKETRMRRGNK